MSARNGSTPSPPTDTAAFEAALMLTNRTYRFGDTDWQVEGAPEMLAAIAAIGAKKAPGLSMADQSAMLVDGLHHVLDTVVGVIAYMTDEEPSTVINRALVREHAQQENRP